jgi:hypothetical protein
MSPNWRWRRCPRCHNVERASDYTYIGRFGSTWDADGGNERRCPNCGLEAPTYRFQVVRERHPMASASATAASFTGAA